MQTGVYFRNMNKHKPSVEDGGHSTPFFWRETPTRSEVRRPERHSLVGEGASEVFLDVGVHDGPEVVIFTVPEQVDDEHLTERKHRNNANTSLQEPAEKPKLIPQNEALNRFRCLNTDASCFRQTGTFGPALRSGPR